MQYFAYNGDQTVISITTRVNKHYYYYTRRHHYAVINRT